MSGELLVAYSMRFVIPSPSGSAESPLMVGIESSSGVKFANFQFS